MSSRPTGRPAGVPSGMPAGLQQFLGLLQLFSTAAEALGTVAAVGAEAGRAEAQRQGLPLLTGAAMSTPATPSGAIDLLLRPLVHRMLKRSEEALSAAEAEMRATPKPGTEATHAARVAAHLAVASTTTSVLTALVAEVLTPKSGASVQRKLEPLVAKGRALAQALARAAG